MASVKNWATRRPTTITLVVFLTGWYLFQLIVYQTFGSAFARWLFYTELPPTVDPGLIFSPISHDLQDSKHLIGNLTLLLAIGGLIEPYASRWKILGLVILGGYIGMAVTMSSALWTQFWPLAGASTGILILWSYSGIRMWIELGLNKEIKFDTVEEYTTLFLLLGIPTIPLYELLINGNFSHLFGVILGVAYFGIEIWWLEDTAL